MARKKESKDILKKREITTQLNNTFALSRNYLEGKLGELGKRDGGSARLKSAQTLRSIARLFVEDLDKGIEDHDILPEECIIVFLAAALFIQLKHVDSAYKVPNGDLIRDIMQ